jgi:hypothetical protein
MIGCQAVSCRRHFNDGEEVIGGHAAEDQVAASDELSGVGWAAGAFGECGSVAPSWRTGIRRWL